MWTRIDKAFPVPPPVRSILNTLFDSGHESYLVGGCVRDFFLGREIKDFDIATSASPEEVERLFERTISVGKAFGVIKVLSEDSREVEVARSRLLWRNGRFEGEGLACDRKTRGTLSRRRAPSVASRAILFAPPVRD
ncbi:hypothetical protein EB061_01345 [bacterium]|nr:hypothetical protein [bacterium]